MNPISQILQLQVPNSSTMSEIQVPGPKYHCQVPKTRSRSQIPFSVLTYQLWILNPSFRSQNPDTMSPIPALGPEYHFQESNTRFWSEISISGPKYQFQVSNFWHHVPNSSFRSKIPFQVSNTSFRFEIPAQGPKSQL